MAAAIAVMENLFVCMRPVNNKPCLRVAPPLSEKLNEYSDSIGTYHGN